MSIAARRISETTSGSLTDQPLPTFVAAGTVAADGGSGTIAPGLPAGHTTGDILLLAMECDFDGTPTAPTGSWAAVTDSPQATTAVNNPSQLNVWWLRDGGSEPALSFTGPAQHSASRVYAFRGCIATGNPWDVTSGGVQNTQGTAMSVAGDTTTVNNCLVVVVCTSGGDFGPDQFSSFANADLGSVTDRGQAQTNLGNGGGLVLLTGTKVAAGAYGATTGTLANQAKQAFMTIALKPPSPV